MAARKTHPRKSIVDRFWPKVQKSTESDGCWEWIGYKFPNGYGVLTIGNTPRYAHRISWSLAHGGVEVSPKLMVTHSCDNRGCVNPEHLKLGTNSSNQRERFTRGANPNSPRRRFVDGKWQWITLPQTQSEGAL